MEIQLKKSFTIVLEDKPGLLAGITATLMNERVPMEGIWGFGVGLGNADVIVVPRDPQQFKQTAAKLGWHVTEHGCFRISGNDKTGALVELLQKISSLGINLHAVDAMAVEDRFGCYIWGKDDDIIHLSELLGARTPLI